MRPAVQCLLAPICYARHSKNGERLAPFCSWCWYWTMGKTWRGWAQMRGIV